MKKFGILLLSLWVATPALADLATNCTNNGGTIVTANSYGNDKGGLCNNPSDPNLTNNCNGKSFCRGGKTTNWWSAFSWCESIGGHLANFSSMCPGVQALSNNTAGDCPNLKGFGNLWVWTSMGWGTEYALKVNLSSGAVYHINSGDWRRSNSGQNYPLCEE